MTMQGLSTMPSTRLCHWPCRSWDLRLLILWAMAMPSHSRDLGLLLPCVMLRLRRTSLGEHEEEPEEELEEAEEEDDPFENP